MKPKPGSDRQMQMSKQFTLNLLVLTLIAATQGHPSTPRLPLPLASHPGNIFVTGETVSVQITTGTGDDTWTLLDYEGRVVAERQAISRRVTLGVLPVGYYELRTSTNSRPISLGVLQPLKARTPSGSPIGVDVATAWLCPPEQFESVASLCALAGMNYVRDRLTWAELEPTRGQFASATRYDTTAQVQANAGLKVLQVSHRSPAWANPDGSRFPLDLRDTFSFHREMAHRCRGQVFAFEPWNEADIPNFGGHTGSEIAALQKAAYLGIKAGNPRTIACLNVLAIHRESTLRDLYENVTWPYFDTYNFHHYEGFRAYPRLYADHRAVSAGKPMWVTECNVPVKWAGDEKLKEPTAEDLRIQAERVTMVYAQALHEGPEAVFYFILPHFTEGQTQFGVLRTDLTPRPAFFALAAAGRLLAGARPLGSLPCSDPAARAFVFAAEPDGKAGLVLVGWSEREIELRLEAEPLACYDHLGRQKVHTGRALKLTRSPVYAILPKTSVLGHQLTASPARPPLLPGRPCPVVLQALPPAKWLDLERSAYKLPKNQTSEIPLFVYNFSEGRLSGELRVVSAPEQWNAEIAEQIEVGPGERKELQLRLDPAAAVQVPESPARLRLVGDFGTAGQALLSMRFVLTE